MTKPLHPDTVTELLDSDTVKLSNHELDVVERFEIAAAELNGALRQMRDGLDGATFAFSSFKIHPAFLAYLRSVEAGDYGH